MLEFGQTPISLQVPFLRLSWGYLKTIQLKQLKLWYLYILLKLQWRAHYLKKGKDQIQRLSVRRNRSLKCTCRKEIVQRKTYHLYSRGSLEESNFRSSEQWRTTRYQSNGRRKTIEAKSKKYEVQTWSSNLPSGSWWFWSFEEVLPSWASWKTSSLS